MKTPGGQSQTNRRVSHKQPVFSGFGDTSPAEAVRVSDFISQGDYSTNAEKLLRVADAEHMPTLAYVC